MREGLGNLRNTGQNRSNESRDFESKEQNRSKEIREFEDKAQTARKGIGNFRAGSKRRSKPLERD